MVEHAQGHEVVDEEPEKRKTQPQYRLHRGNSQVFQFCHLHGEIIWLLFSLYVQSVSQRSSYCSSDGANIRELR